MSCLPGFSHKYGFEGKPHSNYNEDRSNWISSKDEEWTWLSGNTDYLFLSYFVDILKVLKNAEGKRQIFASKIKLNKNHSIYERKVAGDYVYEPPSRYHTNDKELLFLLSNMVTVRAIPWDFCNFCFQFLSNLAVQKVSGPAWRNLA